MSNVLFAKGREGLLDRTIDLTAGTIKAVLLRGSTFSSAAVYLSDLGGSIVSPQVLASKTYTLGVFAAADVVFAAAGNGALASGQSVCSAICIYNDTAVAGTSRVIAWIDTATNLPVTPNGQDVTLSFDKGANRIFAV